MHAQSSDANALHVHTICFWVPKCVETEVFMYSGHSIVQSQWKLKWLNSFQRNLQYQISRTPTQQSSGCHRYSNFNMHTLPKEKITNMKWKHSNPGNQYHIISTYAYMHEHSVWDLKFFGTEHHINNMWKCYTQNAKCHLFLCSPH
jgi:hypothetical protein